jgi:hypothetical protein
MAPFGFVIRYLLIARPALRAAAASAGSRHPGPFDDTMCDLSLR